MAYESGGYGPASPNLIDFFKTDFNTEGDGTPEFGKSKMPGMSFTTGGGRSGFDWGNYPTSLDGSQLSYGLPSIWAGDMTTAETNEWADKIAATGIDPRTGEKLSQFAWNTFTDPMAKRKGLGVYNLDFDNPLNRPKEQLTPAYAAAAKAHEAVLATRPTVTPGNRPTNQWGDVSKTYQQQLAENKTKLGVQPGVSYATDEYKYKPKASTVKKAVKTVWGDRPQTGTANIVTGASPGGFGWRR